MMDGRTSREAVEGELLHHIRGCQEGPEQCIVCREVEWLRSKDAIRPSWGERLRRVLESLTPEEYARLARLHGRAHPDCRLRILNRGAFIGHLRHAHRSWTIKTARKESRCPLCGHGLSQGEPILLLKEKTMQRAGLGRYGGWIHIRRCLTCERGGARVC